MTLADLTISQVGHHGVQVRGELGASDIVIHHLHILDTGQQLIKGSAAAGKPSCRNGLVACSTLEYTNTAPSDYTNGVDVLNGEGWVVRDNIIRRIRGPRAQGFRAGPAILFWRASRDTIVERNLIIDCQRGIALGLSQDQDMFPGRYDHEGGVVRRNVLCNLNSWADEAIEVNSSPGTRVEHNTVLVEGKVPWSISIRFPATNARVSNNLCNRQIILRDGAKAEMKANIVTARRDWFASASAVIFVWLGKTCQQSMPGSSTPMIASQLTAVLRSWGLLPTLGRSNIGGHVDAKCGHSWQRWCWRGGSG